MRLLRIRVAKLHNGSRTGSAGDALPCLLHNLAVLLVDWGEVAAIAWLGLGLMLLMLLMLMLMLVLVLMLVLMLMLLLMLMLVLVLVLVLVVKRRGV
jgi:hypothetical protein